LEPRRSEAREVVSAFAKVKKIRKFAAFAYIVPLRVFAAFALRVPRDSIKKL
jgi:hypothetical protein